ncbi:uncharacterized protein [Palaemon carinicauda]|uniref:uncharacterized protein n=1 Tax=Palaemon carinicauda TaxID=392227 RepID=UPI0035B5C124
MDMDSGTYCEAMVDGSLTEAFKVKTGELQVGILSPLLFIMVIDYVMNNVMQGMNNVIQGKWDQRLCDLEYADDIVLIASTMAEMRNIELVIIPRNTEVMKIKSGDYTNYIGRVILPSSDSFTYLGTIITTNESLGENKEDR